MWKLPHSLPLIRLAFGQPPYPLCLTALDISPCQGESAFPLTGEGGTRSVTDEGEAKGLLYFTNKTANPHNSCIRCRKML